MNYAKYENSTDLEGDLQKLLVKYTPTYTTTPPLIINSFGHIFSGGYAAAYYSYKWAEVLEADVFGQFAAAGVISREVGKRFKSCILERGDAKDAGELFEDFMGREPDA